jgi:hypothetical protein
MVGMFGLAPSPSLSLAEPAGEAVLPAEQLAFRALGMAAKAWPKGLASGKAVA